MEDMKRKNKASQTKKLFIWLIAALVIATAVLGIRWATYARPPLSEAMHALENDELVQVDTEPWLAFMPAQDKAATGFIFYPGGRIDPRGYAPLMRALAKEGYLVVIPEMPLNMAPFHINAAREIQAHYKEIDHWAIGGHSVGGTMAALYAKNNMEAINGLIFWASYPAADISTLGDSMPVTLIYGSTDPMVNDESVEERRDLLPLNTRYVRIEGGDHHQFGSYVIREDEDFAGISRAEQHQQILRATLDFLSEVN